LKHPTLADQLADLRAMMTNGNQGAWTARFSPTAESTGRFGGVDMGSTSAAVNRIPGPERGGPDYFALIEVSDRL
jgi:hypothetical protein